MGTLSFISFIVALSLLQGASAASSEDMLVSTLLERLKPAGSIARPIVNAKDNVKVTLQLSLVQISRVKYNSADFQVWIKMAWQDPRLKWDPSKYDGLSSVALPADLIWLPDIRPYSATGYQPDKEVAGRVVLSSSGDVVYVLPARLQVNECATSNNRSVTCDFSLGSWVYNGFQVDTRFEGSGDIDLSNLVNGKWEVALAEAERREMRYACCPEPYVTIAYKLRLDPKAKESHKSKKSSKSKKH